MIKFSLTVSNRLRASSALFQILGTVAAVIASIFIVYQAPGEIRELSLSIRSSVVAPILFGGIGLLVFFSLGHAVGTFLGLAWTLVLFGLSLKALWLSGISEPSVVGGLLPWSDSLQYLSSAREVVLQGNIDPAGSNRPIFPIVLACLLAISDADLKITLAIFVSLNGACAFFLGKLVQKKYGLLSGVATVIILFLFYRRFSGTLLTENIGFAFGILALIFLWIGTERKVFHIFLTGLFMMTLALLSRSGAFLCLPLLICFGWLTFLDRRKLFRNALIPCAITVLVAALIPVSMVTLLGGELGATNSNFGHVLYGQAVGGKGWTQVAQDYPDAAASEYTSLALQHIQERPYDLVSGGFSSFRDYFHWNRGAFGYGFIRNVDSGPLHLHLRHTLYLLSFLGLGVLFKFWRLRESRLLITLVAGILVSVPFIPPIDADGLRVYAATIPINVVLIGVALKSIVAALHRLGVSVTRLQPSVLDHHPPLYIPAILSAMLVVICIATPLVFSTSPSRVSPENNHLRGNNEDLFIILTQPNDSQSTNAPTIRPDDFRDGLNGLEQFPEFVNQLSRVPDGAKLYLAPRSEMSNALAFWIKPQDEPASPLD